MDVLKHLTVGRALKIWDLAAAFYLNVKNRTSCLFPFHLTFALRPLYRSNQVTSRSKVPLVQPPLCVSSPSLSNSLLIEYPPWDQVYLLLED